MKVEGVLFLGKMCLSVELLNRIIPLIGNPRSYFCKKPRKLLQYITISIRSIIVLYMQNKTLWESPTHLTPEEPNLKPAKPKSHSLVNFKLRGLICSYTHFVSIERLHASFCHGNDGHFGAQSQ